MQHLIVQEAVTRQIGTLIAALQPGGPNLGAAQAFSLTGRPVKKERRIPSVDEVMRALNG